MEGEPTLRSSTLLPKLSHAAMRHRSSGMMDALEPAGPSNLLSPLNLGGTMPNLGAHAMDRESKRISRQLSSATPKKLKRLTESNQLVLVKDLLKQSKKDIDQLLIQNWLENELDVDGEDERGHRVVPVTYAGGRWRTSQGRRSAPR